MNNLIFIDNEQHTQSKRRTTAYIISWKRLFGNDRHNLPIVIGSIISKRTSFTVKKIQGVH